MLYRIRRHPKKGKPIKPVVRIVFGRHGITAGDPILKTKDDTIEAETAHQKRVCDRLRRQGILELVPVEKKPVVVPPVPEPEPVEVEVEDPLA